MPPIEIHQSSLSMLLKCGLQYQFRYIQGIKRPPGVAAHVGTGLHTGAEFCDRAFVKDGAYPEPGLMKDAVRDAVNGRFEQEGVMMLEPTPISEVRGQAVDRAILLAEAWRSEVAPLSEPMIVKPGEGLIEKPFNLAVKLEGFEFNLAGKIDKIDKAGAVRDLKSSAKSPAADTADRSVQLTIYARAAAQSLKVESIPVQLDNLVSLAKGVKYVPLVSKRGPEDFQRLYHRLVPVMKQLESGIFLPASEMGWWCSPEWCGYWDICKARP